LRIEQSLFRPTDIEDIYGDNTLVKEKLGWQYEMDFKTVLSILIDEEMTARKIITPVKGSNL
jgi:GDPmannose 4,6-dehydratase